MRLICWITSPIGIKGGDRTDSAAKSSLEMTVDEKFKVIYTEMKPKINKYIKKKKEIVAIMGNA